MPLIEWSDEFSVNVKAIDDQHKELVALVNNLYDINNSSKNHEEIDKAFNDLADHTAIHFKYEEGLMDKYQYPESVKHIEEHNNLLQKVKGIEYLYSVNDHATITSLALILVDWLKTHIFAEDMNLAGYLNSKGVT